MYHFAHILMVAAPLMVMTNTNYKDMNVFVPKAATTQSERLEEFLPKSECNFNETSDILTKKIKYFTYDCLQPNNNWLLINVTEANYIDVLRK